MSYFFSDPLSIVVHPDMEVVKANLTSDHMRALRMLPSFKHYISSVIKHDDPEKAIEIVKRLLGRDTEVIKLLTSSRNQLKKFLARTKNVLKMLDIVMRADTYWSTLSGVKSKMELLADVLSGEFIESSFYRELPRMLE